MLGIDRIQCQSCNYNSLRDKETTLDSGKNLIDKGYIGPLHFVHHSKRALLFANYGITSNAQEN